MKKRFFVLPMIMAMLMMTLAACGNDEVPTNAIVEPTPTIEPTAAPSEETTPTDEPDEGIVDEGTLDEVPEDVEGETSLGDVESTGIHYDYTKQWEVNGMETSCEAWNDSYAFVNDPSVALNYTYFKNGYGEEMAFVWCGPNGVGEYCGPSNDGTTLRMSDAASPNYRLYAWYGGKSSDESELMKNYDADTIMGIISGVPIADSFQVEEDDTSYHVIFKVSDTIDGNPYIGYAYFVDYYETMDTYQFKYLVEESIFDENEALAVVNSIYRIDLDEYKRTLQE